MDQISAPDRGNHDASSERIQLLMGLDKSRLEGAIRSLDLERDRDDRLILPDLFLALARSAPERVFGLFDVVPGDYHRMAASKAFPFLAGKDPDVLRHFVMEESFEGDRNRWLMIAACDSLGKADPGVAVDLFEDLPPARKKSPLGVTLLKRAAASDPALVVSYLTRNRDSPFFTDLFRDVLYTINIKDPSRAFELVNSYPEVASPNLVAGIYQAFVEDSPENALMRLPEADADVLEILLSRRNRDSQDYFSVLHEESPEKALALLDGLILSESNHNLFESAASRISSEDFEGAVSWIASFPVSSARAGFLRAALLATDQHPSSLAPKSLEILRSSGFQDSESARAVGSVWSPEELPEIRSFLNDVPERLRPDVVAGLLDGVDLTDRAKVSEIAEEVDEWKAVGESGLLDASIESLGVRLGASDPEYAVGLADSFDSRTAQLYSRGFVTSWTQNDPGGAARWLSEHPAGPVRDASVRAFADAIRPTDPEAADRWLRSLR